MSFKAVPEEEAQSSKKRGRTIFPGNMSLLDAQPPETAAGLGTGA
jgi:hypothetical protein